MYSQDIRTIVGYQFLRPSHIVELDGNFFALYQNGELVTFTHGGLQPHLLTTPAGKLVVDVFTFDDLLWIRTGEGHLYTSVDGEGMWSQMAGQFVATFTSANGNLFLADELGVVYRVAGERLNYQLELYRALMSQPSINSFCVRGDTIGYYKVGAFPDLNISTLASETRVPSEWVTISRMIEMSDGSIIAEAVPFELARFHGSIFDGPQRINEQIGVDLVISLSIGRRSGEVCLGIVGGIGSIVALSSNMATETPVFIVPIASAAHYLPVDTADILVLENSGFVFHGPTSEVVFPGYLPIKDGSANVISGLLSELDGETMATMELRDSILIIDGSNVLRTVPSDTIKDLGLGAFSHFIQRGDTILYFGKNAIVLSLDDGASWKPVQSGMNATYVARMRLQDSSSIVFGDRSFHISDRTGTKWNRYTFPYPYLTMWEARSSDSIILARGQFEVFAFARNLLGDTILAFKYRPVSNVATRPFIYSIADNVGRIAIPLSNGASHVDRIKLVAMSVNGLTDSVVVVLTQPLPDDYNQFYSAFHADTAIVFQPGTGRVYHIVDDVVVQSYSIPVRSLLPFPDVRFPGGEVNFEGTSAVTLIHPPSGVKIVVNYKSPVTSVICRGDVAWTDTHVFPNPAHSIIIVPSSESNRDMKLLSIQLHNLNGIVIRDYTLNAIERHENRRGIQLDVDSIPSGYYSLVVKYDSAVHVYSVVIHH